MHDLLESRRHLTILVMYGDCSCAYRGPLQRIAVNNATCLIGITLGSICSRVEAVIGIWDCLIVISCDVACAMANDYASLVIASGLASSKEG